MTFKNRIKIKGTITTVSPLHIGDGEMITKDKWLGKETGGRDDQSPEIMTVATDCEGRACIPGKALKGNLRSWLADRAGDSEYILNLIDSVFGTESQEDTEENKTTGGKAEFHNSFVVSPETCSVPEGGWNAVRLTKFKTSASRNRITGTVVNRKLYNLEYVPEGVTFGLTITGQDLEEDETALLLAACNGFQADEKSVPVTIGGNTGDKWGRFEWNLDTIGEIIPDDVMDWVENPDREIGYDALKPVAREKRTHLCKLAEQMVPVESSLLVISSDIVFDGPFLVNDTERTQKDEGAEEDKPDIPDLLPLLDKDGHACLPVSSFRGAFRSQAERILRTLYLNAACHSTVKPCPAIYDITDVDELCPVCRTLGGAGWKSPVDYTDFQLKEDTSEMDFPQEFVAVDRFTGGAANQAKFNAEPVLRPVLTGEITINLKRIKPWMLGLMAYTIRDFMESDVTLGFGSGRWYGIIKQFKLNSIRIHGLESATEIRDKLAEFGVTADMVNALNTGQVPGQQVQNLFTSLNSELWNQARIFSKKQDKGENDD